MLMEQGTDDSLIWFPEGLSPFDFLRINMWGNELLGGSVI